MIEKILKLGFVIIVVFFSVSFVEVSGVSAQINLNNAIRSDSVDYLPFVDAASQPSTSQGVVKTQATAKKIGQLVGRVVSFLKLFLGAIAVVILFISGYRLVTAGSTITEEITKQKSVILYTVIGLIIVTLSEELAGLFLGGSSGTADYILNERAAVAQATRISARIVEVVNYFLSFVGAGAILMLVMSATKLVLNPGEETAVTNEMKIVGYAATGIVMIAMSEVLINKVVFPQGGTIGVDIDHGVDQLVGLSNYVLGFLGVITLVAFVISGFMLLFYGASEEVVSKVKSILGHVILGVLVSFSAYTIVATIVNLSYTL